MASSAVSRSGEVRRYAHRRYRGFFQRLLNRREQSLMRELLDAADLPAANVHVVDIPCGYGRFYQLFKARGWRVTALDRAQGMIDLMRERDDVSTDDRERAARADIMEPFAPGDGDIAVCVRLLQHIPQADLRRKALANLSAAGRGRVLCTYYDRACLHYWTKKLAVRLRGKTNRIDMISSTQMAEDAAHAGLRIKRKRRVVPGIHAHTMVLLEKTAG